MSSLNMPERALEVAFHAFAAKGYNGVSMRDVSKLAGVAPATLYHHFQDKSALYLATVRHAFASLQVDPVVPGHGRDALWAFIERFVDLLQRDPNHGRLLQWLLLDQAQPDMAEMIRLVFEDLFEGIREAIRQSCSGADDYSAALALAGMVFLQHITREARRHWRDYDERREHREAVVVAVMDFFDKGFGA